MASGGGTPFHDLRIEVNPSSPSSRRTLSTPMSPTGSRTPGKGFNFRDVVNREMGRKLKEAQDKQKEGLEEKLLRVNGLVQRRIVCDYPYRDDYRVGKVIGSGLSGEVYLAKLRTDAKWQAAQKE